MNRKQFWAVVALSSTVLGMHSTGRAETPKGSSITSAPKATTDVVKVGEYQALAGNPASDAVVTKIQPHAVAGRQAATLFVRDIPVITFFSSSPIASEETKVGVIGNSKTSDSSSAIAANPSLIASTGNFASVNKSSNMPEDDPVQKASAVAAKINQLVQNHATADQIKVSWKGTTNSTTTDDGANNKSLANEKNVTGRYAIKLDNQELVEISSDVRLPDTTNNLAQDALQVTNRLRRLIGNAQPISEITDLPQPLAAPMIKMPREMTIARARRGSRGIASWYGGSFHGNPTASGETYNKHALTAAHRSLPFGTRVRVTNTRNGRSVVVRINDRGPFIRGRVIDLSAAAARVIGMTGSGIAPVRIEILGR